MQREDFDKNPCQRSVRLQGDSPTVDQCMNVNLHIIPPAMAAVEAKTKHNVANIQRNLRFLHSHDGEQASLSLWADSMSDVYGLPSRSLIGDVHAEPMHVDSE